MWDRTTKPIIRISTLHRTDLSKIGYKIYDFLHKASKYR